MQEKKRKLKEITQDLSTFVKNPSMDKRGVFFAKSF